MMELGFCCFVGKEKKYFDPFVVGEEREFGMSVCVAVFL
jgi:hypothetical protein